jgi:hypothetical protein
MHVPPCLLAAALLVAAASSPAAAQVHLFGRVADERTGAPIAGAHVVLMDHTGRRLAARTVGDDGEFAFFVRRHGRYFLTGSMFGYRENTSPGLNLGEHGIVSVELRLDPEAVLLAPLEVMARAESRTSPVLANFEARLHSGLGTFVTRDEITRLGPARVTDVLVTLPGVYLENVGGAGHSRVVHMSRAVGCAAQIFVDGFLMNRMAGAISVDDVVSPASVEGIEVYRGLASMPAEFLTPEARCGVVAIWTRRGGG